jgi:hypothetical protein
VEQFQPQRQEDKYAEVKSLVYENTVGIVGKEKGSGKTSKLGYLIGEHIKLGHLVWMVNPFAKGQQWKGIKVFGRGYNFVEATNAIREFTRIASLFGESPKLEMKPRSTSHSMIITCICPLMKCRIIPAKLTRSILL